MPALWIILLDALISIANEKSPALKPGFFELSLPYKSKASNKMRAPLLDEPAVAHNFDNCLHFVSGSSYLVEVPVVAIGYPARSFTVFIKIRIAFL
jgi:hypothetical protein